MNLSNEYSFDQQIIDDNTRILNVKKYWNSYDDANNQSRPKSRIQVKQMIQIANEQKFKLPMVKKVQNALEKNRVNTQSLQKEMIRIRSKTQRVPATKKKINSVSVDFVEDDQSIHSQQQMDYPLPSQYNTRDENIQILQQLSKHVKLFKKRPQGYSSQFKDFESQQDEKTFLTKQKSDQMLSVNSTNQNEISSTNNPNQKQTIKSKLQRQLIKVGSISYPYDLYMINYTRQKVLEHIKSDHEFQATMQAFEELVKPDKENMARLIAKEEMFKKMKELTSRRSLDNAQYGIRALKQRSQLSVQKKIRNSLPEDSRFYESSQ